MVMAPRKKVVYHGVQKWKWIGQSFISLSCSDDIAAATFSTCMQTLARWYCNASSCPAAILLGYLLLRITPKLYFEFGIFEIWHFNLALLQVSNMWHSIWWWNLRRHLTLHSREKSYRYKQGDLKRRMFSTFSTRLRIFVCMCVYLCVSDGN